MPVLTTAQLLRIAVLTTAELLRIAVLTTAELLGIAVLTTAQLLRIVHNREFLCQTLQEVFILVHSTLCFLIYDFINVILSFQF